MLELNRLPKVANVLVFQDHFMKQVMAYVTPNQMAKLLPSSCTRVTSSSSEPWPSSWAIRVLTSWAASLMRCVGSSARRNCGSHIPPTMNGLVERSHQTIMQMIRKLGEDKKAHWPGHLSEKVHAYNATQSALTGYSPHYLMFGCRPWLPIDFYFSTIRSAEVPKWGTSTKHVDKYVATAHDQLRATLWEAQAQSMAEAQRGKQYYDWKKGTWICSLAIMS